jgi:hypothetical protein
MKIDYRQGKGIALYFPVCELKVALGILKAIYTISKLAFVKEAIDDLEDDLLTRKIPMVIHYHSCFKCFCEVDDTKENAIHLVTPNDDKWAHRRCPDLKPNRPN